MIHHNTWASFCINYTRRALIYYMYNKNFIYDLKSFDMNDVDDVMIYNVWM